MDECVFDGSGRVLCARMWCVSLVSRMRSRSGERRGLVWLYRVVRGVADAVVRILQGDTLPRVDLIVESSLQIAQLP